MVMVTITANIHFNNISNSNNNKTRIGTLEKPPEPSTFILIALNRKMTQKTKQNTEPKMKTKTGQRKLYRERNENQN